MRATDTLPTLLALALVGAMTLTLSPIAPAGATHDSLANFTVQPAAAEDRQPGIDDASYKSWSAPPDDAEFRGFEYMEYSVLEWEAGTLGMCGVGDSQVAGIDRGNDDAGTHVDDTAKDNIEGQPVANEDKVVIDFQDPDNPYHQPIHMNVTDEFVSYLTDCRGNPDDPGWYQLTGTINGTTWSGEHVERTTTSHYFYICDCASYDEAVERIGPPPSQSTPTENPGSPTATRANGQSAPTSTATPVEVTATATAGPSTDDRSVDSTATRQTTAAPTDGATGTASAESTPTPARWARRTVEQGPGFGVVPALVGLVAALAVLAGRRR